METCDRATSAEILANWVRDARARTLDLIADLDDDQLMGPRLPTINPLLWEIGHTAWFQEHWVLRQASGHRPIRADGDKLWNSISIAHEVRWDLPLPSRDDTLRYLCEVRDRVLELLDRGSLTAQQVYFVKLSVFHEDMHTEAFTYTRQTLGYRPPALTSGLGQAMGDSSSERHVDISSERLSLGDIDIPGGKFPLGATQNTPFVFDNEKWAHPVRVKPFAMARAAVSQREFAAFVEDGGYCRPELWSNCGWRWRQEVDANHPLYWKQNTKGNWLLRHFDTWRPLDPNAAVIHVGWYEAEAYCRWADRRLPTEAEWELAATGIDDKRHYPWGEDPPTSQHANLNWQAMGTVGVDEHPAGDSPYGCAQMLGNVWEWTASTFDPFPGFVADPYREYSRPCFGQCKVLRGGCWSTRSRLIRNTWRNFYRPDRRDVLAGFRTCADVGGRPSAFGVSSP